MLALLVLLTWAGFVFVKAVPLPLPQDAAGGASTTNQTATFENVTDTGFGVSPTLPGVYKELYFGLFEQGPYEYAAGQPVGIAPQSFPVEAVFGYSFTSPEGPAYLTTNYNTSAVRSFQLFDFYFGCQARYNYTYPGGSEVTLAPQNCTLTVSGFCEDDTSVPPTSQATFDFVPNLNVNSAVGISYSTMMRAVLPDSFRGMRTVQFSAVNSSATALSSPAVFVDSMSYAVTHAAEG
ncbi:MAG: hypothetical protein Q9162_000055 [Coniocarpon cinnabarinum]